jgi:hypothetical protein
MWNTTPTSHAHCVGFDVIGAAVETKHGHTTLQLQFSK